MRGQMIGMDRVNTPFSEIAKKLDIKSATDSKWVDRWTRNEDLLDFPRRVPLSVNLNYVDMNSSTSVPSECESGCLLPSDIKQEKNEVDNMPSESFDIESSSGSDTIINFVDCGEDSFIKHEIDSSLILTEDCIKKEEGDCSSTCDDVHDSCSINDNVKNNIDNFNDESNNVDITGNVKDINFVDVDIKLEKNAETIEITPDVDCNFDELGNDTSSTKHHRFNAGNKPFSCKYCSYSCNRKNRLFEHMRTHTGERPHSCKYCSYRCSERGNMLKHMRTHTGEKPYSCKQCSYTCTTSFCLSTHMRTHTGEKPYSCKYCSYRCNQRTNLSSHMKTHTGEKPFSCKFCTYGCTRQATLSAHLRTHTGEKPYSCKNCPYRAARRDQLKVHEKKCENKLSDKAEV